MNNIPTKKQDSSVFEEEECINKIYAINKAIEEYFALNPSVNEVRAKDLMPLFIKKGIFTKDHRGGLPIREILRDLYKKDQLRKIPSASPDQKTKNINWYFVRSGVKRMTSPEMATPSTPRKKSERVPQGNLARTSSDETYVLDLCDEALGLQASRQHRFDFLTGDPGKRGRRAKLPVDAYYEPYSLVVEFREKQHTEGVRHFDKPDVTTVSGCHRGEQRKLYDQRRRDVLPKHGIKLIEISYSDFQHDSSKKIIRNQSGDLLIVKSILSKAGFETP